MTFRSASAASDSGGTITTSAPAGATIGDVEIAWYVGDGNGATFTFPAGYAQFAGSPFSTNPESGSYGCAWRVLVGGEAYVGSWSLANDFSWVVACWSGRSGAFTFATATADNTADTTTINLDAAGGTAAAGDDLAWFGGLDPLSSSSTQGLTTPPTSFTEQADTNSGDWVAAFLATLDAFGGGATGTLSGVATINAGNQSTWGSFVIALASAAAPDPSLTIAKRGRARPRPFAPGIAR